MLEYTKKPLTDNVFLGVICRQAMLEEVKAVLEAKGCKVQQEMTALTEKEHYTIEETFPGFHAGHSLLGARYREDVSQRQLAKLTGVSVQNISAMEHGRRTIGKEMAKRFAKALNTDWRLLLS
ncbi:MAG: helix-turn-helix transcriptional regulator [Desulfovibrio sp.]|jgi:DNA-binding XRE family transcriptional regulator|nr:helix-turn-helix transcriptional regulator [Desulfovibrio sp.]